MEDEYRGGWFLATILQVGNPAGVCAAAASAWFLATTLQVGDLPAARASAASCCMLAGQLRFLANFFLLHADPTGQILAALSAFVFVVSALGVMVAEQLCGLGRAMPACQRIRAQFALVCPGLGPCMAALSTC